MRVCVSPPQDILREFACMLPSCRSRWPGIIHPALRTPSLPSPWWQQKKNNSKKRRGKRRIWRNVRPFKRLRASDKEILVFSSALSRPLLGTSGGSGDAHGQQPAERTDKKKGGGGNPEKIPFSFDGAGSRRSLASLRRRYSPLGRTGGMEPGRASAGQLEGHMRSRC